MSDAAPPLDRFQEEVERANQRNIKGWNYLVSTGPPRGVTPKDVIRTRGTMTLYHYHPMVDEIYRVPVLLVMATTNRAYIFDLAKGQSLVEFLVLRGYDVYVLDWNPPRADEGRLRLEDYTLDFIPDCIRQIASRSGEAEVSVIGYCMGGVLSLVYAALHPGGPMKNLACFATPFDWSKMGLFNAWADPKHFNVDQMIEATGVVPPELIALSFEMLRPVSKVTGQIQLWDNMWNDEFVKSYRGFDRWTTEVLPLAGEYFKQIATDLLAANRLYSGELQVGGRRVDVGAITAPFLHAVALHDHIVPYEASKDLVTRIGSTDKEEVVFKGGHVSVVAGGSAVKRLWPKLDEWLGEKST